MFREALHAMLRCPKCGDVNKPSASLTIEIQQGGDRAECVTCSFAGPVGLFLPKEMR